MPNRSNPPTEEKKLLDRFGALVDPSVFIVPGFTLWLSWHRTGLNFFSAANLSVRFSLWARTLLAFMPSVAILLFFLLCRLFLFWKKALSRTCSGKRWIVLFSPLIGWELFSFLFWGGRGTLPGLFQGVDNSRFFGGLVTLRRQRNWDLNLCKKGSGSLVGIFPVFPDVMG